MNESPDHVLINTPELKALYAPQQATDEYWNADHNDWRRVAVAEMGFCRGDEYRRARSLAWLPLANCARVQYPAWLRNEQGIQWFDEASAPDPGPVSCGWTHWQPAPAAPAPPPAPVDPSRAAYAAFEVESWNRAQRIPGGVVVEAWEVWQAAVAWVSVNKH